jgi:hypothetical protein
MAKRIANTEPWWPTTVRSRKSGGRVLGTDNSVWLYRAVPMAPVVDAVSPEIGLSAAEPLMVLLDELSAMTPIRMARRSTAKAAYRQVHILLVNIPSRFSPLKDSPIATQLAASFPDEAVDRRLLLVGVRLIDKIGGTGGFKEAIDSVVETLTTGGTPLSDFDQDYLEIDTIMSRAGMSVPTAEDFRLANAWWNHGSSPDAPMLIHEDHIHIFGSADSARSAARLVDDGDECAEWPPMARHHTISFGCIQDFDLPFVEAQDRAAHWAASLINEGAVAISIRGKIEPPKVTRAELRRQKKKYTDDVRERESQGKMTRAEQEEILDELSDVEAIYATGGPPTLTECSTLAVFAGRDTRRGYDLADVGRGAGLVMHSMVSRQETAMSETWLCSPVRANPYLHDLPSQTVAASGLPSLSLVGDEEGALLGFTERDRQPSYISPTAAADEDSIPAMLVAGQSGSGKTLTMLYLADQFARLPNAKGERTPVVVIDPKSGSDHSAAVMASGGRVASLDNLAAADGVFDPMRFATRREVGVELASSMLMAVNPWGAEKLNYETPLIKALSYGSEAGADCIGQALKLALEAGAAPAEMVSRVFDLADASPMFRACVGMESGGPTLRTSEGITLIKVGDAHLDLPEPGAIHEASQQQRVALGLVRMMVFGSAMALTGRQGVIMLDEAWVFLGAGRSEVERLGRLARSQQVFPMLFTQRVTDALNAGLSGYISRGLILPIQDPEEAAAACELFRLEPTPERLGRLTARGTIGGTSDQIGAPNWSSMRALRDRETGNVLRGAVGIYVDLSGRAVPVEIKVPKSFFDRASTNPEDIRRRIALQEAEEPMIVEPAFAAETELAGVSTTSDEQVPVAVAVPAHPEW